MEVWPPSNSTVAPQNLDAQLLYFGVVVFTVKLLVNVFGAVTNAVVVWVVVHNEHMRVPSNWLLVSLAGTDLLILLLDTLCYNPFRFFHLLQLQGRHLHAASTLISALSTGHMEWVFVHVVMLSGQLTQGIHLSAMVAVALDRCYFIHFPIKYYGMGDTPVRAAIALSWLLPTALFLTANELRYREAFRGPAHRAFFGAFNIGAFAVLFAVYSVTFYRIYQLTASEVQTHDSSTPGGGGGSGRVVLRRHTSRSTVATSGSNGAGGGTQAVDPLRRERKLLTGYVVRVVLAFIAWMLGAVHMIYQASQNEGETRRLEDTGLYLGGVQSIMNSVSVSFNALIYAATQKSFEKCFKAMLCGESRRPAGSGRGGGAGAELLPVPVRTSRLSTQTISSPTTPLTPLFPADRPRRASNQPDPVNV